MKRYLISATRQPIEPEIVAAADRFLPRLAPPPTHPAPSAGFSVLHRGEDATWLTLYLWVHDLILHCRAASANGPDWHGFGRNPDSTEFKELPYQYIGCVWELPVLAHERDAWVRHMRTPDVPDLDAYLSDTAADGPVGAPQLSQGHIQPR